MIAPVAHPMLGLGVLDRSQILEQHSLLEFDGPINFPWLKWQEWLTSQGWSTVKPKSTLRFNQYDQVIAAAIGGQGIALGHLKLIQPMLADGRLQILRGPRAGPTTSYGYWLIKPRPNPCPDVLVTAQWIKSQAERIESGDRL
jgi:LysR family glycine cleavage system transcriptional activator